MDASTAKELDLMLQASHPPPRRIIGARADCLYGATGHYKTTQVGRAAQYVADKYGKKSRLVSADLGGWQPIQSLVDAGIIDAFLLTNARKTLLEDMKRLAGGWWPKDAADPSSPLQPTTEWKDIGLVAFEGLTSWANHMMSNLLGRQDVNIPGSPKDSFVLDGSTRWNFSGLSHYGFIQSRIFECVTAASHLPVEKVIWTALECKGKDEQGNVVYGPDIIGQKATGICGAWFGSLLHLDSLLVNKEIDDPTDKTEAKPVNTAPGYTLATPKRKLIISKPQVFLFLHEHVDPNDPYKIAFPAKPRGPFQLAQEWPDFMEPDIYKYYEKLDDQLERAGQLVRQK